MKTFMIIDTETTNDINSALAYDLGYIIFDEKGNELLRQSFVITEIFRNPLMQYAYFKDKIPQYENDIKNGTRKELSIFTIRKIFQADFYKYHCSAIIAHNAIFDYRSLQNTLRYITTSKMRFFFPQSATFYDTLKMSRQTFAINKVYKFFCKKNNYLNTKHQPRLTAEIIHRFLSQNKDFNECHTGLEDCEIEKQIFIKCLKMDSKIDCNLF